MEKATRSQASKVSNNRSVKVDTTSTRSSETSQRESVVRTIENINVSSPLNFVFRQLVQDILTLYTVKDVRVVVRPSVTTKGKAALLQNLPEVFRESVFKDKTPEAIIEKYYTRCVEVARGLGGIDLLDPKSSLLESYPTPDKIPRYGVNTLLRDRVLPPEQVKVLRAHAASVADVGGSEGVRFDGLLIDLSKYCLKTEGVYVDCYLSDTQGLDEYSKSLQVETVKSKERANESIAANVSAIKLAESLVNSAGTLAERMAAFEKLVIPTLAALNHRGLDQ